MTDRNLACKTCGTKVFKIQEEVDAHHKESHPEMQSQSNGEKQEGYKEQTDQQ